MTAQSLRLLLVEDVEDDALLLMRELRKVGYKPDFMRVETAEELKRALANGRWDVVFSDYSLPAFSGLDALRIVRENFVDLPFIIVSGFLGEETAVEALQAGAHDYLIKGRYARLAQALERALRDAALRHDRRQTKAELTLHQKHLEEIQAVERELRAAHERIHAILEQMSDGFASFDRDWRNTHINTAAAKMLQIAPEQLLGKTLWEIWPLAYDLPIGVNFRRSIQENIPIQFEMYYSAPFDRWFECRCHPTTEGLAAFFSDITERKQAAYEIQHSHNLLKEAQRLGKLGSWELDLLSGILRWSEEVYRIFELDPARFMPSYENFLRMVHPDDRDMVDQVYQRSLQDRKPYIIEHRLLFSDGRIKWVSEHGNNTFDLSGKPLRSVGMVQDITERKETEEAIRALALHDQLTGLPNRRCLLEHLHAALSASARHDDYGAVVFIDMDNFKTINDTWGHEFGDLMLIEMANRLAVSSRAIDTASRFGGDEFVVLLGELGNNRDEAVRRAGLVAEKIRETLAQPYLLNCHIHNSSPSIGIALYHGNREPMDALLQHADAAMYQAKSSGGNMVCFFSPAATD